MTKGGRLLRTKQITMRALDQSAVGVDLGKEKFVAKLTKIRANLRQFLQLSPRQKSQSIRAGSLWLSQKSN